MDDDNQSDDDLCSEWHVMNGDYRASDIKNKLFENEIPFLLFRKS